jgi:hypothetical protein
MRYLPLALLLLGTAASAQPGATTRYGLGVRLNGPSDLVTSGGDDFVSFGDVAFLVPVDINGIVRVEPELGIARFSSEDEEEDTETSATQFVLGLGVMALVPHDDLTLTFGARARVTSLSLESEGDFGDSEFSVRLFGIGPAVGGEYPFSRRFSIGAEVGLEYQSLSFDVEGDDGPSASGFGTRTSAVVRFFL